MGDEEIRSLLLSYVKEEMDGLNEREMVGYNHDYSTKYKKKLKKIMWSEKYFGKRLHLGYVTRRVAVIVFIVMGLITANEVSARLTGFNPWKYLTSFNNDSKMDVRIYEKRNTTEKVDSIQYPDVSRKIPLFVPKHFKESALEEDEQMLYAEWTGGKDEYLQYVRTKIEEGMKVSTDGEYESKTKLKIKGYDCNYCVKGEEAWFEWDDKTYTHLLAITKADNPKDILQKMATSLYE